MHQPMQYRPIQMLMIVQTIKKQYHSPIYTSYQFGIVSIVLVNIKTLKNSCGILSLCYQLNQNI